MRTANKFSSLGDVRRRFRSETEKECRGKKEGIISQMAKDLGEVALWQRTSKRSHYGKGPRRGRTMVTAGLDLRQIGSTPTPRPQRGRTATGVLIRLLDDVRPLWGRMPVEMSSTAGQDLRLST